MPEHDPSATQATSVPRNRPALEIRHGAYLPHWTREGSKYAVCFRLGDSLPQSVLRSWVIERDHIVARARQMGRDLTDCERQRLDELHSERVEKYLDAGAGECWMRDDRVATLVHDAMFHFDGQRHDIAAWCIMPNHVHAVVRPLGGHRLPSILHAWKGFTGLEANKLLKRSGLFWQPETYDHLIRDGVDFERCVRYVLENPAKAGLENWKWVGMKRHS